MTPFYTYDDFDRITQVEDGSGITIFTYDDASRIETVDGPWENDTLTYSYDELDRITSVQLQNGLTRTHIYDTLGRLVKIQVDSNEFTYTYNDTKSPLVKELIRPNGITTSYGYDSINRLLTLTNSNNTSVIQSKFEYRYNDHDLRDQETITGALAAADAEEGLNQSDYNAVNQLMANSDPAETFVYDDDGNMVEGYTKMGFRFTAVFDQENRLASISFTDGDGKIHLTRYTYRYDGFLVRIEKLENDTLVSDTRIVRNGKLAIQERDGNNNTISEYVWGKNLGGGIGGLLQLRKNGGNYFYLYDGKGNVTSVVDNAGAAVAQYRYNPFGKLLTQSGTLDQPFQFSTKRYDSDTGLNYYGYRFYNPSIERWMNRDPLGEEGGINLYGFVWQDPINWTDPWGLMAAGGVGVGAGAGAAPPIGGGSGKDANEIIARGFQSGLEKVCYYNQVYIILRDAAFHMILQAATGEECEGEECEEADEKSKKDYDPKEDPGQQYEEIVEAQRKAGRESPPGHEQNKIRSTKKSKQRDKEWLKKFY